MKLKEAAKLTLPSLALFTPRFQMDRLQFKKPNFLEPKSSFRFISKKTWDLSTKIGNLLLLVLVLKPHMAFYSCNRL